MESRSRSLSTRPTERHRYLRGRPRAAGVPLAPYLRQCALAQRIRSCGNWLTQPDIDELVRLRSQLNGFARVANTACRIVGRPKLGELLAEIRD